MEKKKHILTNVWESYPEALANNYSLSQSQHLGRLLADLLTLGPYYYYTFALSDYSISTICESILDIHGLEKYPLQVNDIIDLIHPEDLEFVIKAEKATLEKMQEIGFQHQLNIKTSYCFRMRVQDGSYQLFHHQAIHLTKDDQGKLSHSLNIHTNIHHITQINNYIVLVNGIGERKDYCQLDLSSDFRKNQIPLFSKREMDILPYIAKGWSSKDIGSHLFISEGTVRTHRKNLLKKTNTHTSILLVKQCLEWGYI